MLNRFQFARLRGFRRGAKKNADAAPDDRRGTAHGGGGAAGRGVGGHSADADGFDGEVRDSWDDDDRVARLLARRAAAQEAERRAALERLSGTATEAGSGPAPIDTLPASKTRPATSAGGATAPTETRPAPDVRTTTVPALEPSTRNQPGHGANGGAGDANGRTRAASPERIGRYDIPRGAPSGSARVVCIASGKGGTGKSVVATNLALLRARMGERVLLVDFDAGLANDHLLLGLAPPYDIGHVMTGEVTAHEALVDGPGGIKLLAGGVGRQVMIDPTRRELDRLFKALKPLESDFDLILVDHGAGLSYSTVAHLAATSTLILVTNHEVTALSDGYALYKRAHMVNQGIRVGLVINRVPDEVIAQGAWERFRGAAHKFLGHTPELVGWVPVDPAVPQAVQMRMPATLSFPGSDAVKALERVAAWPPIDHARSATAFYDRARRALR